MIIFLANMFKIDQSFCHNEFVNIFWQVYIEFPAYNIAAEHCVIQKADGTGPYFKPQGKPYHLQGRTVRPREALIKAWGSVG